MSIAPIAMLVDTNVWLDYYLPSRKGHDIACSFITKAVAKEVSLYTAFTGTKDLFYLIGSSIRRHMRAEKGALSETDSLVAQSIAWSCLENQSELATPIGADAMDALLARQYRCINGDYEDNIIIASAQRAHATIVTADQQLIAVSPVAALSVDSALHLLSVE